MMEVFEAGGYPMWFLLVAALALLASAGNFAARPTRRRAELTRALGLTTFFSILWGTAVDLAAVGYHGPEYLARHPEESLATVALRGLGESMSPAILGFSCLAVAAVLASFGVFRGQAESE